MKIDFSIVIDDDPVFSFGIQRMMKMLEFSKNIMSFENGEDAIKFLTPLMKDSTALPDVILLDVNMPIMNGWEFLDEFTKIKTQSRKKVIIYVVSSSVDSRDVEKAKQYHVVSDYVVKPITIDSLKDLKERIENDSKTI